MTDDAVSPVAPTGTADASPDDEQLTLRFYALRTEPDIEAAFLAKGGVLGAAAARAETHFSLTGSDRAVSVLVTDKPTLVELPIPTACLLPRDLATGNVQISHRARLNVSGFRIAAAINGTVVSTLSGQGGVPITDLFLHKVNSEDADTQQFLAMPFKQVPLSYSNWATHQAVVGVASPKVLGTNTEGELEAQNIGIQVNSELDATMKAVEPHLQAVYDSAWALRQKLVYDGSPKLTKAVMAVPSGINASGYHLAAAVNDTPAPFSDATLESIMAQCVGLELAYDEEKTTTMLEDLAEPSIKSTMKHAEMLGSALSTFAAFHMPYRVDGTPVVMPDGVKMVPSESWRAEASGMLAADDCDGSAANIVATIRRGVAAAEANDETKPFLRALGNSIGAHYVYGVSVLGANAGHAAAADAETVAAVAGHAVAIAIPKVQFDLAMERGVALHVDKEDASHAVPAEHHATVTAARYEALYPSSLVDRMPEAERKLFGDRAALTASPLADAQLGPQPLAFEGTTPSSARMTEPNAEKRRERAAAADTDKATQVRLTPNITRPIKTLESTDDPKRHRFYAAFVELSMSIADSDLYHSEVLRKHGQASPHYVLSPKPDGKVLSKSGASAHDIATGSFVAVPLWRMGTETAGQMDPALKEAQLNAMPSTKKPISLIPAEEASLKLSLEMLQGLDAKIREVTPAQKVSTSQHIISFAALVRNPSAIKAFCATVTSINGVAGILDVKPVTGLAVTAAGEDAGVFVCLNLNVPL